MKMFLVFVILVHVSQHASGVVVYEGAESVLLPFHIERLPGRIKVLWSRFDLNPTTVHQFQAKEEVHVQNQLYSNRTSMSEDSLRTGNYSLTLMNPRLCDSGKYTCIIFKGGKETERRDVELQVKEPYTFPAEAAVLLLLLVLLLLGAAGAAVYLRSKLRHKLRHNYILVSEVEVKQGVWSVELPSKTKVKLTEGDTVEWSRCGPEATIHVYPDVSEPLLNQNNTYDGRTKMKVDSLKTGNLSLTLSKPHISDSGTYICTVQRGGKILTQKVVRLKVKAAQDVVEVNQWQKYFTLPFRTKAPLPEDVTVEWSRSIPEAKAMIVYVYKSGKDWPAKQHEHYRGRTKMEDDPLRSKDLSLTISYPGFRDSGTYICTVERHGNILAQEEVKLQVKSLHEVVVREWEKYFTLPFRTEDEAQQLDEGTTVEWSRYEPKDMIVHINENSEDNHGKQHEYYCGRTEMNDDPLRSKDLSLTIYHPSFSDSGTYICTVIKDGKVRERKEVQVRFKVSRKNMEENMIAVATSLPDLHIKPSESRPVPSLDQTVHQEERDQQANAAGVENLSLPSTVSSMQRAKAHVIHTTVV